MNRQTETFSHETFSRQNPFFVRGNDDEVMSAFIFSDHPDNPGACRPDESGQAAEMAEVVAYEVGVTATRAMWFVQNGSRFHMVTFEVDQVTEHCWGRWHSPRFTEVTADFVDQCCSF